MLVNLAIGLPTILLCLVLQAAVTFWSVRYYINQSNRKAVITGPFVQIRSLLVAMIVLILGNFLQIMIWGSLFMALGEFDELYEAVYHSAVNFSSLGYGDVVMSASWRLLGPLEAADGMLMFGVSTALIFTLINRLVGARLHLSAS